MKKAVSSVMTQSWPYGNQIANIKKLFLEPLGGTKSNSVLDPSVLGFS